jgi:hypothetical protein
MKALISPNESFTLSWVSSWDGNTPVYSEILYCQRVAEVESDDKVFEVAQPLFWLDCPDDCKADQWYYKDGVVYIKPQDASQPEPQPE